MCKIQLKIGKDGRPIGKPANMKILFMGRFILSEQNQEYFLVLVPEGDYEAKDVKIFIGKDTMFRELSCTERQNTDEGSTIKTQEGNFYFPKGSRTKASFERQEIIVSHTPSIYINR